MKEILLTNKNISDVTGGDVDIFVAGGSGDEGSTVCMWLNGEHGEEKILTSAVMSAFERCAAGKGILAVDVSSFASFGYNFSYLYSIFTEVLDGAARELSGYIEKVIFFNAPCDAERAEEYKEYLTKPYEEVKNQIFGDPGDDLKAKFESYINKSKAVPFNKYLISLIANKGMLSQSKVCASSGISKYTMSKIVNGRSKPSKDTLAALAIGLKLNADEAEELYNMAGYHLGEEFVDKVIRFFISIKKYDIDEVNYCLYYYGYPTLGERPRDDRVVYDADYD